MVGMVSLQDCWWAFQDPAAVEMVEMGLDRVRIQIPAEMGVSVDLGVGMVGEVRVVGVVAKQLVVED